MMPKVTIIVPCFNQGKYLAEALQSVFEQSFRNWECIVVNDGSNDNTEKVTQDFCAIDRRFILISKINGGLASARNAGLMHATGDYVQFLDADDVIHSNKLKIQVEQLVALSAELSICNYTIKTIVEDKVTEQPGLIQFENLNNPIIEVINKWENGLTIPCHSVLISRDILIREKICFDEELINHEDWAFWVEVFMNKPKCVKVDEALCVYMRRGYSMSSNRYLMRKGFLNAIEIILKKISKDQRGVEYINLLKEKRQFVLRKYKDHQPFSLVRLRKKIKYLQYFILGRTPIFSFNKITRR